MLGYVRLKTRVTKPTNETMTIALTADVPAFTAALASGDRRSAIRLAVDLLDGGMSAEHLILEILAPAQAAIGTRWARGELTVREERLASRIAELVLDLAAGRCETDGSRGRLVLACAEREHHNLPARMVAELLRLEGFTVLFIGSPRSASSLTTILPVAGADALVLSCSIGCNLLSVPLMSTAAHDLGVRVLAGGRAFGSDDRRATRLGADAWAPTVNDCGPVIDGWIKLGALRPEATGNDPEPDLRLYRAPLITAISRHLPSDAAHCVDFLLASAACEDRSLFTDYVSWLRSRRPGVDGPESVDGALNVLAAHIAHAPELARILVPA